MSKGFPHFTTPYLGHFKQACISSVIPIFRPLKVLGGDRRAYPFISGVKNRVNYLNYLGEKVGSGK